MNIKTENTCPPIPNRNFDWLAYDGDTYQGPGSPIGRGPTKEVAIADLLEKLPETEQEIRDSIDRLRIQLESSRERN